MFVLVALHRCCPALCKHHQPCPIHPCADKALLPLLVNQGFLLQSSLSSHPSLFMKILLQKPWGDLYLILAAVALLTPVSIYTAMGSTETTHQKPLKFLSINRDSGTRNPLRLLGATRKRRETFIL